MTSKLRKAARGRDCQVRVPGICNYDPATTVLAHLNGGGIGRKRHDLHAAWCCSACHAWLDGGYANDEQCSGRTERDIYHLDGVIRTQEILIQEGILDAP